MNELIKVTTNDKNEQLVSGRELHKFLEVTERYSNWFGRMLQYGFEENIDFTGVKSFTLVNNGAKQELQDHALKINMAKEISMIQRNEKGKIARKYFIDCEMKLKKIKPNTPQTYLEALKELVKVEEEKQQLLLANTQKDQIITELQPKASYYDLVLQSQSLLTITQISKDYGLSGKRLNDILHELKIQYKQSDTWLLYQNYASLGLTKSQTHILENGKSVLNTKWTQKGRLFIYDLLKNKKNILPIIESNQMTEIANY